MDVALRHSKRGDETDVYRLVTMVLAPYGLSTNLAGTDSDLTDIQGAYADRGGIFQILEADGEIIGSYGLYYISDTVCELRKMYLLPQYHGQGHGRSMMDDALVQARKLGFREMILETNSVLEKAQKLYEQYGFEPYEPGHLSDRCDMAMRLVL
jgi:putative acetyltransferase